MTVKELVEMLSKVDQALEVTFRSGGYSYRFDSTDIEVDGDELHLGNY